MRNHIYRACIGPTLVALMVSSFAMGAAAQGAGSGCFSSAAKMRDTDVSAFMGAPVSLLTQFPSGGAGLTTRIRSLAGSSGSSLNAIAAIVAQASPQQRSAIGAGLARAAKACAAVDPAYAQLIQETVAGTDSPELKTAFAATTNDVQTASLAPIAPAAATDVGAAPAGADGSGPGGAAASLSGEGGAAGAGSSSVGGSSGGTAGTASAAVATEGSSYSAGSGSGFSRTDDDDDDSDNNDVSPSR